MKRVILALTGTVAGVAALLSFKTHSPIPASAAGLPSVGLPASSSSPAASAGTTAGGGSSAPPDPSAGKRAASATRSAAPGPTVSAATATYTGRAVDTQYGTVQIKITVAAKKITNVAFVQLTAFDGRSQEINSYAAPILLQETMTAQSANINNVSGASYTSQGYAQSLQSALDKAGI